jgi:hypothetical protein
MNKNPTAIPINRLLDDPGARPADESDDASVNCLGAGNCCWQVGQVSSVPGSGAVAAPSRIWQCGHVNVTAGMALFSVTAQKWRLESGHHYAVPHGARKAFFWN